MTSTLNPSAPAFVPAFDTLAYYHPSSPRSDGFVMLGGPTWLDASMVADEDVLDPVLFPPTPAELDELVAVDTWNQLLAELDVLEHEDELLRRLQRARQEAALRSAIAAASAAAATPAPRQSPRRAPAAPRHQRVRVSKPRPVHQPR